VIIDFVGTDETTASEGNDRAALAMPGNSNSLITQGSALGNTRTAMVIASDGPVNISAAQGDFPAIMFSGKNPWIAPDTGSLEQSAGHEPPGEVPDGWNAC
jgi:beta-glucosidase